MNFYFGPEMSESRRILARRRDLSLAALRKPIVDTQQLDVVGSQPV